MTVEDDLQRIVELHPSDLAHYLDISYEAAEEIQRLISDWFFEGSNGN